MKVCNYGHDEIVYDGWVCPFCQYIDDAEKKQSELQEIIDELKQEAE